MVTEYIPGLNFALQALFMTVLGRLLSMRRVPVTGVHLLLVELIKLYLSTTIVYLIITAI